MTNQSGAGGASSEPVDWFSNVTRLDRPAHADIEAPADVGAASDRDGLGRLGHRITERYRRVPSWVLILQLFLAVAWGRSGLANALRDGWWSGQGVLDFLATETGLRVGAYRFVLTGLVEPFPAAVAVLVVVVELVVAVMLIVNHRPMLALGIAAAFNVQLILAGAVNPSVFFLVGALVIGIWRLETTAGAARLERLSSTVVVGGIIAIAFLAPAVRTLRPDGATEDPALALIFLALLTMVALWWVNRRVRQANRTLAELTGDIEPGSPPEATPSLFGTKASLAVAASILAAGFLFLSNDDRESIETTEPAAPRTTQNPDGGNNAEDTANPESASNAEAPDPAGGDGSFDRPYPFGLSVTLNYNDLDLGEGRQWRVQVLESVLDGSNPIRTTPTADGYLAMARVRLTYFDGASPAPIGDIQFRAVGRSGTVFAAKSEGCSDPEGRLDGGQLDPGRAVEGWLCWPVPTDEVDELVLAVEAKPADGVLYMTLREAVDG